MDRDKKKSPAPKGTDEVLKELFRIMSENPEKIERITFTIRPSKLTQHKPGR